MTINDEILVLANKAANKGKKPTVALIKAKLSKSVPLPTIISTLKSWQHDPSFTVLPEDHNLIIKDDSLEKDLRDELTDMRKEILELKLLVQQLLEKQKSQLLADLLFVRL